MNELNKGYMYAKPPKGAGCLPSPSMRFRNQERQNWCFNTLRKRNPSCFS